VQAITSAYSHALIPVEDKRTNKLALQPVPLGTYGPGKYVAPMVWDSLTARISQSQWLLKELTPKTFLERYGRRAWPESERTVTTRELWTRFTTQVGLPLLTRQSVLLEMLRLGEYEGLFAIGLLIDEQSPRDQRDSYPQLHFKEQLQSNIPLVGERWIVMRPEAYKQVAEQPERVTAEDIVEAMEMLRGSQSAVSAKGVYEFVKSKHPHGIDGASYGEAVQKALKEHQLSYREDGQVMAQVAADDPEALAGEFFRDTTPKGATPSGRTIVISGSIDAGNEFVPLFQKIVKPLSSQNPTSQKLQLTLTVQFNEDPGGTLDISLAEMFDKDAFPGLRLEDSKG